MGVGARERPHDERLNLGEDLERPSGVLPRLRAVDPLERDRPGLSGVGGLFPQLADAAARHRAPRNPLERAVPFGDTVSPKSTIFPARSPPSRFKRSPSSSTQVWCHLLVPGSQEFTLVPFVPLAPFHVSRSAHPFRILSILLEPAGFPSGVWTSQSPTQKSNCRYSGARQGAGVGVGAGAAVCAAIVPPAHATRQARERNRKSNANSIRDLPPCVLRRGRSSVRDLRGNGKYGEIPPSRSVSLWHSICER